MSIAYWEVSAILLFVFRYLRLVVNLISNWTFKPIPVPENPTYTSQDVTVIIPTIDGDGDELRRTIKTCLATQPFEIMIVTIRVLSIPKANKRSQMCEAIPQVKTPITVFADDDVIWPITVLPWMLAPFEDPKMGGVGTSQRLMRPERLSLWGFLGSLYLERRNFDCSACLHMDGGLPCLSGRTVAYRTDILQDEAFTFGFTHETWRTYQLNADDDNFITRWMFTHGYKIAMQYHKAAEVQTTLEDSPKYLKQCLRWIRSNWRSNLTSMFVERHYWWTHPWTTYAVFQTTLTAWAFVDPLIFFLCYKATEGWPTETRKPLLIAVAIWIFLFAKTVKLMGHFIRYPGDIVLLPVSIMFGYVHGILKLIGLFTLSETAWGSRDGADEDDRFRMIRLPPYDSEDAEDQPQAASGSESPLLPVQHGGVSDEVVSSFTNFPLSGTQVDAGVDRHLHQARMKKGWQS
ncbi:Type 2 glycosyltransferase [Taxawa tesnikishii (nom. ined.)]|nr:Type 2 glycosyltransferase [Dothideales sp. JES 119]